MPAPSRILAAFSTLSLLIVFLAGCTPIARERTLPPSIRSVYVPMILNRTSEPGLEEYLTMEVQEEILADGRLDLVDKKQANAIVEIELRNFDEVAESLDEDDFPTSQSYLLEATMRIRENIPGRPTIGGTRALLIRVGRNADPRSTGFDPEPDVREALYRSAAEAIVRELLTGQLQGEDTDRDPSPELHQGPVRPPVIGVDRQ